MGTHETFVRDTDAITIKLSGKRRIVVQEFKGNWFVNLREYYEDKSGEMKPGKKVSDYNGRTAS